jgi:hypothetical protein
VGQVSALQRCVDKAGKVTYSDQACAPDQQARRVELSGAGSAAPQPAATAAQSASAQDQIPSAQASDDRLKAMKGYLAEVEHARKRDSLAVDLRNAERALSNTQSAMDAELAQLRNKKAYANNNLAGATWESSISQEMTAIAQRYDTKIRMAADRVERLRAELAAMEAGG